jgi:hypothetical protein
LKDKSGCGANHCDIKIESAEGGIKLTLVKGLPNNAEHPESHEDDPSLNKFNVYNHEMIDEWNVHLDERIPGDIL